MKTPRVFWPMLKSELALGRSTQGVLVVLIAAGWWFCAGAFPLVPLYADGAGHGYLMTYFEAGFVPLVAFQLLGAMSVWMAFATIPALGHILSSGGSVPAEIPDLGTFEFMFTRAVNRRTFFRAKTTAFCVLAMTPFFINLLAAPLAPDIRISRHVIREDEAEARRFGEYRKVFPETHHGFIPPERLEGFISHGPVIFCAWLTWTATLCALLMQCYGVLVARYVKPNNAWTGLYALVPILILLRMTILGAESHQTSELNISSELNVYEKNFLFFSTHLWLMVAGLVVIALFLQAWCERRFSRLEIL